MPHKWQNPYIFVCTCMSIVCKALHSIWCCDMPCRSGTQMSMQVVDGVGGSTSSYHGRAPGADGNLNSISQQVYLGMYMDNQCSVAYSKFLTMFITLYTKYIFFYHESQEKPRTDSDRHSLCTSTTVLTSLFF